MNPVEYDIKEVHSIKDITNEMQEKYTFKLLEPHYLIDLTYDCYGIIGRRQFAFGESSWEIAKIRGWFFVRGD